MVNNSLTREALQVATATVVPMGLVFRSVLLRLCARHSTSNWEVYQQSWPYEGFSLLT